MKDSTEQPYFMTNEKWYYYDEEDCCMKLTKDATPEAIKSYKEYYEEDDEGIVY